MEDRSINIDGTGDTVTVKDSITRDARSFTRVLTAEEIQQLADGPVLDLTGFNRETICDR